LSATATPVDAIWYTRCPVPTASSFAIDHGWLDEEFGPDGIHVASLRESAERSVRESHFDQRQPHSFREGGSTPPIWARSRGADVRLAGATWVDQYQAVVALDPMIREPRDLRGRRLGIAEHINDQIDFQRAKALRGLLLSLELGGLGPDEVEIVPLREEATFLGDDDPSHAASLWSARAQMSHLRAEAFALVRGEVDAIYLSSARGLVVESFLGAHRVADLGAHPDPTVRVSNSTPTILTASGELVRARPDLVRRYVSCIERAADWARDHRSEARRIMATDVGEAEEWIDLAYGPALHERLRPRLDDDLLDAVSLYKDWLLAHGFLEADFDVHEWVADLS
jgi:ABC-type nitrate/sulfonate/bicarbonate transport system substrate-binding protein